MSEHELSRASRQFLDDLLATPGVSGYEQSVQNVVRDYVEDFATGVETDMHGNLIVGCNTASETRIMFAGHCDQIGLIISQIDENGYLYTQTVGGWDPQQLVGQRVTIWTKQGPVPGVIARKPIHLLDETERKQVVKAKDLWIDIGCAKKDEADQIVQIGDSVTFKLGITDLINGRVTAPAMDNRSGVWVVIEALRRASERNLTAALFAVSTVQEEIGLRGAKTAAFSVDPQIGIAVDVTHATDCPTVDQRQQGEINLGKGPVIVRGPNINSAVCQQLIEISSQREIPYQLAALGRAAPNDSNALQITRGGVATGLVSIPNRYMHSAVETISLSDIDYAADLLAEFACQVQDYRAFIPS